MAVRGFAQRALRSRVAAGDGGAGMSCGVPCKRKGFPRGAGGENEREADTCGGVCLPWDVYGRAHCGVAACAGKRHFLAVPAVLPVVVLPAVLSAGFAVAAAAAASSMPSSSTVKMSAE